MAAAGADKLVPYHLPKSLDDSVHAEGNAECLVFDVPYERQYPDLNTWHSNRNHSIDHQDDMTDRYPQWIRHSSALKARHAVSFGSCGDDMCLTLLFLLLETICWTVYNIYMHIVVCAYMLHTSVNTAVCHCKSQELYSLYIAICYRAGLRVT